MFQKPLVPPRRGQRHKSLILPTLNKGRCFKIISVGGKIGLVDYESSTPRAWFSDEFESVSYDESEAKTLQLTLPPNLGYTEENAIIGGVGKTLRWNVITNMKLMEETKLFVLFIEDTKKFSKFIDDEIKPFAFISSDFITTEEYKNTVLITVPDGTKLAIVAAKLHDTGFGAIVDDENYTMGKLGIERLDRSDHMWWNQDNRKAGPLRDIERWNYSWCKWKKLPFTWHMLASNFPISLEKVGKIPLPLRNYVVQQIRKRSEIELEILKNENYETGEPPVKQMLLKRLEVEIIASKQLETRKHCVTSRLCEEQTRQLLSATYYSMFAPFDSLKLEISRLIHIRYALNGYCGRQVGGYRQNANYLGHGALLRNFKGKDQYKIENLSNVIINKVLQPDGRYLGSGFKGTRGKHGHADFPSYVPKRRMKRTIEVESKMRKKTTDCFKEYKTNC